MQFPTAGQFVRNVISDSAKVAADAGGFWDQLATYLILGKMVPTGKLGRMLMFIVLSHLGAFAQANLNDQTVIGKLLMELISDMPSELAKRILEHSRATKGATS